MAWKSVAICGPCWTRRCEQNGEEGRVPVAVIDATTEQCAFCGESTKSGIYVRANTNSLAYPPKDEE